jgi:hypothetical protein
MGRPLVTAALVGALGGASILGACVDEDVPSAIVQASSSTTTATATASSASTGSGGMGGSAESCDGGMGGGSDEEPEWCCLGNVEYPSPATATIDLGVQAIAFVTNSTLEGLTVKACATADTACASPVAEGITDAEGMITLTVPTGDVGFDGFFDVTGSAIRPALVFPFPPPAQNEDGVKVQLVTNAIYPLLQTSVSFTPDPARGDLVVLATDCNAKQAPGVQVAASTADADSVAIYVVGMAPSLDATETDATGVAGWFNLPAGPVDISANRAIDAAPIGTISVFVRPGSITYTTIPPTP